MTKYVSEQDQIIAGMNYDQPDAPAPSTDQSKPTDESRLWWASTSKGGGYYFDNPDVNKPRPKPYQGVPPWPYSGAGLFVVIARTTTDTDKRAAAYQALEQLVGPNPAPYIAANDNADPAWNAAVEQVLAGTSVDQAIANCPGVFNAGQLAAAKLIADSL